MASTSRESLEHTEVSGSAQVKITILASEWGSSKGGLSTINRELAIQLAKSSSVEITFFVPQCSDEDKEEALRHNVHILKATPLTGYEELEWLSFPPKDLEIHIIVGHGVKLGRQAQVIRNSHECKWVQVVHTDPEELGMFKSYTNPISAGEKKRGDEVELCNLADFVVGIGPKLTEAFRSYLGWCRKEETIFDYTPGLFDEFMSIKQVPEERKHPTVLVFGRGDAEDFELKGFDIAARAVASLPDTHLLFFGAPDGKLEEVAQRFLDCDVPANRLKVRSYDKSREGLKRLFCEVDLVLMPSRTEGFGLAGLEALSAGLPVLVCQNSGFGEAVSKVPFGSSFVINSEDSERWATAIKKAWEKGRQSRLEEAEILRSSYERKYSWSEQSDALLFKMINLVRARLRLKIDCEVINGRGAPATTMGMGMKPHEPHSLVQDDASNQPEEVRSSSKVGNGSIPSGDEIFRMAAHMYLREISPSKAEEFNGYLQYLKELRKLLIVDVQVRCLIITVEIRSLQILEDLWKDYTIGHLNKMAQKFLLPEDVLKEFGVSEVRLTTTIAEEEYRTCRDFFERPAMAEGGEDYSLDSEFEPDDFLIDSDGEALSDEGEESDDAEVSEDEEDTDEEEEISLGELERTLSNDEDLQEQVDGDEEMEGNIPVPRNIRKILSFINFFYGHKVKPIYLNILTDFADAEIFLIDGDSLLLELLEETTLDWTNGGQFLHLTYLVECFLQYFTDKGGVFHVVFFKDMENMWGCQPSMLLARQALILHLEYNTPFTVVSSIDNCWGEEWKDYVVDKCPAFMLLTDAESIPWEATSKQQKAVEFFFRSLLCHSLGQELNCVFMSGIEMTATKVMGFYTQSSSDQKYLFRKVEKQVHETWQFLVRFCQQEASPDVLEFPNGLREKVQTALRSPPKGGCRELATELACGNVLTKLLDSGETSTAETVKPKEDIIKLFLLHSILLKKLPLKYRTHSINNELLDEFCKTEDGEGFPFREFHINLWKILKLIQEENDGEETSLMAAGNSLAMKSVADMMDGRLVHSLFLAVLKQGTLGLRANSLPEDVIEEAETAWSKVVSAVNSDALEPQFFPLLAVDTTESCGSPGGAPETNMGSVTLRRLLDVDNYLVNEYAGKVRTRLNAMANDDAIQEVFVDGEEFDERYHWHTRKLLSDDYDRTRETIKEKPPDNERQRFFFYRNKQTYVRFLRMYGNSLLGGSGKEKVIIVKEDGTDEKKGKDKTNKVSNKSKQYQEENKRRRKDEEMKKEQERWNNVREAAKPYLDEGDYVPSLKSIDAFLAKSEFPQVRHPALMMKAKCCFGAWRDTRSGDPTTSDMKYPVLLMETVQRITQEPENLLTDKEKKKLSGYMLKLGFEEIAETLSQLTPGRKKRAGDQFSVHQTSARFQLDNMGHLLKRDERSDPDTRVDNFIPDTWQRKLLDAVDNKESAVIVAPTSSGKTYASYYCMEKVLEESNEGVVVYVSPTKALVNQVAATIYARFRKTQLPAGRSVYGIFTRDYRHNTLNSQILVTIPQCLEILFLSPRRHDWARNVRYVIFDEVHCLGQEIGAEVWEHLLLLIRCPFLALSATIGNPNDLLRWLQAAQDFREQQDKQDNGKLRKSYKVRLVTCDERYSDLEKSIYLPSPSNGDFSLETRKYESDYDVTRTDEFVRLHPCAQLATKQLIENGFPGDMALTPKEALQLYDVMAQHWPDKESLKSLCPEEYFKEQSFIPKSCARQYEKELKKEFKSWADDKEKTKVEAVIQSLNSVFLKRKESADKEWNQVEMPSSGKNFVVKNFPKLVEQLKAQGKLPALVFSFDRVMCEKMAAGLVRKFEEREEQLQEIDDAQKAKLAKDKKQREQTQKILKRQRDVLEKIKKSDRYHPLLEQVTCQEVKGKESVVLNEPLPECTLAFTHGIGNEDLKKIIARIETSRGNFNKKRARTVRKQAMSFKAFLRRGISYHHAGLDSKRRSCVEMLFRERYLQVVTATGTLALGIHMPCKTVVLAGDSPYLNSLQYRQMSGRAGRRGFDPVGNVVFFGIPYRKVQRLITANIPWLVGNFPINVTLVLRLLLLTSKGDNTKDALTKALALLSHPFICQKHPKMESQIKKHFLFSVELLARLGLINVGSGAPQEMAGLATHLHYHEPANFVLVSFLQRGLFHKLCKRQRNGKFSEEAMRTMVLILNHLFARRYLHANFERRLSKCPSSKVILEDLPKDFAEALQEYNDQVTGVFSQYLTTVAAELENDQGEENKLPLSGIEFPRVANPGGTDEDCFIQKLGISSIPYSACSSFAALSGNSDLKLSSLGKNPACAAQGLGSVVEGALKKDDVRRGRKKNKKRKETISTAEGSKTGSESMADHHQSIDYLLKIVRQDVYTDMNVVPTLPLKMYDSAGRLRRLNAYALDFYKHGSKAAIVKENEIKAGEVFDALKDFCLTVKSISCSLEEWGPANDNVVLAFKQLAQEFGAKFKNQFDAEI